MGFEVSRAAAELMIAMIAAKVTDHGIQRLAVSEREQILRAIILSNGDCRLAADRLDIGRSTLYRRLGQYRKQEA